MARSFLVALASIGLAVAVAGPLAAQRASGGGPELLVLAPEIEGSADTALARLAQRFTARILQGLAQAKVRAVRTERGLLDSLRGAKAAGFALDASLTGEPGRFSAQLRLLELASGDELRAYMFGPGDADGVLGLADRAPPRIAAAMAEARDGR
jgi:hypothetical protein